MWQKQGHGWKLDGLEGFGMRGNGIEQLGVEPMDIIQDSLDHYKARRRNCCHISYVYRREFDLRFDLFDRQRGWQGEDHRISLVVCMMVIYIRCSQDWYGYWMNKDQVSDIACMIPLLNALLSGNFWLRDLENNLICNFFWSSLSVWNLLRNVELI